MTPAPTWPSWIRRINDLSAKAAAAGAAVQETVTRNPKSRKLRDDRAALGKKLDALKNATETGWNGSGNPTTRNPTRK